MSRKDIIRESILAKMESSTTRTFVKNMIFTTVFVYLAAIGTISLIDLVIFHSYNGSSSSFLGFLAYFASGVLVSFVPITIVTGIMLAVITMPLIRVMKRNEKGEKVTDEEYHAARKRVVMLPQIIFIINIAFPILMNIVQGLLSFGTGAESLLNLIKHISIFILAALVQNAVYQKILMAPRAALRIYTIADNERNWFYRNLNRIMLIASVVFACTTLFYGSTSALQGAGYRLAETAEMLGEKNGGLFDLSDDNLSKMREHMKKLSDDTARESAIEKVIDRASDFEESTVFMFLMLFLIIAAVITTVEQIVSRARNIQEKILKEVLRDMSEGDADLTKRVVIVQPDSTGELSELVNMVLDKLQKMFGSIVDNTKKVATSSSEISSVLETTVAATEEMLASISQINTNANKHQSVMDASEKSLQQMLDSLEKINNNVNTQAAYVEQTSSAMTEMVANIQSVNEVTAKASELSQSLLGVSSKGGEAVLNSITAVREIEASSSEVSSLVSTISKIIAQTNMLAMNAAIEAAHAGDAGRGFAVVAEEVRNLADDSSANLKTISENMKAVMNKVNNGVNLSEEAGASLREIGEKTMETTRLMNEVAAAMREQASGANEVLDSINSLVTASGEISSLSEMQQKNNQIMRENLGTTINAFTEVQSATKELTLGNQEILNGIEALKEVIRRNEEVVSQLMTQMKGYKV